MRGSALLLVIQLGSMPPLLASASGRPDLLESVHTLLD